MMNTQRAAEIQVVLEGIRLPANRDELIAYASRYDAVAARELAALPDRSYGRIDEVGEALLRVQPGSPAPRLVSRPESGLPPGGDSYVLRQQQPGAGSDGADAREEEAPVGRSPL
jgi:hypothetical protein